MAQQVNHEEPIQAPGRYVELVHAQQIASAVLEFIGPRSEWAATSGSFSHRADLALVDAVMSIRGPYERERRRGTYSPVRAAVWRYRVAASEQGLTFMEALALMDPARLAELLRTQNRLRTGRTKAEMVVEAAGALSASGYTTGDEILRDVRAARRAYMDVPGLWEGNFDYFTALIGQTGQAGGAGRWVNHFAYFAIGYHVGPDLARVGVQGAARILSCTEAELSYAIWAFAAATGLETLH